MCLGWPIAYVLRNAGVREQSIVHFEMRERIHYTDAEKIRHIYEELSMRVPKPEEVRKSSITIARKYAKQRKYVPPLAWDDIDNDIFNPHTHLRRLAKDEDAA